MRSSDCRDWWVMSWRGRPRPQNSAEEILTHMRPRPKGKSAKDNQESIWNQEDGGVEEIAQQEGWEAKTFSVIWQQGFIEHMLWNYLVESKAKKRDGLDFMVIWCGRREASRGSCSEGQRDHMWCLAPQFRSERHSRPPNCSWHTDSPRE